MNSAVYQRYHRCWLIFEKDVGDKQECTGYVKSNYVGDLDKRQSTTGYVFTLKLVSVSW